MLRLLQYWLKGQTLLNDMELFDRLTKPDFDARLQKQDLIDTLTELIVELKR
jgi:hypothetical protein